LNDDFFDDGVFPEYPTCYDMLFEILKDSFVCYKTPRSVNTMAGIIKDINENLSEQTQIYIAEAGARLKGDILEITKFLNPQIVIVGEIGAQHIEYFKTLDNIRATKLEALQMEQGSLCRSLGAGASHGADGFNRLCRKCHLAILC